MSISFTSPTATRSNATSTNRDELFTVLADLPHDSEQARECRTAIIESYLPMASRLARRFRNRGPSMDDLIQVARLGLVGAVERFEPQRGVDFTPYAVTTILGELKRYFRDTTWAIRVPRALQEQHLMINAASADFSQQTGRAPTPTELSSVLGLAVKDVKSALHAGAAYRALSLDAAPSTPGHVAEEYLRDETTGIAPEDWVPVAAAVRRLPERDRQVIYLRFFEDLSQSDIAEQIGVSQMQVSRILSRTLRVLHDELGAA
jgi:RNA polymerase sigma-B factor